MIIFSKDKFEDNEIYMLNNKLNSETGPDHFYQSGPVIGMVYPDLYRYGVSNLGHQTVIRQLREAGYYVGRAFVDVPDNKCLIDSGIKLTSLDYALLSFPFEHPHYLYALYNLNRCGIPLRQVDREDEDPIVVSGGFSTFNPEPYAPFVDVVIIGDSEGLIVDVVRNLEESRRGGLSREKILRELDRQYRRRGVYVPSLLKVKYDGMYLKEPIGSPLVHYNSGPLINFPARSLYTSNSSSYGTN